MFQWFQGGQYEKENRIDGKIVLITGGNTGIGLETAVDLAIRGGKIYIACRDQLKSEIAVKEIKDRSKNSNVHFLKLDLASMSSVREFSRNFHIAESRLDILICNAGIMAIPRAETEDKFEMQLQVNHLGHFLLTNLLLDMLKLSSPSRIVVVSSSAHYIGKINKDDLMSQKSYYKWGAYGQSKLSNILFTRELARRLEGTGVTVNCCHPGAVNTELQRNLDLFTKIVFAPLQAFFFKTPKSGAQTQIRLAVDPDLKDVNGKYFADCKEKIPSREACDDETAKWLWTASSELTKIDSI